MTQFSKTYKLYFSFIVLLVLIISGCEKEKKNAIEQINIEQAFKNKKEIKLSDIAKSVEYIPLEIDSDFVVGSATRVFADNEYLVVVSFRQQFIFDRQTGKFIREVGNCGRDPNGYRNTNFNLVYNESRKSIFASGWDNGIIEYSIEGTVLNKIKKPDEISNLSSVVQLNDLEYLASVSNLSGTQKEKVVRFNKEGTLLSSIPNTDFFVDNPGSVSTRGANEGWFYWFGNKLFLKGCFNDTVFEIIDNTLLSKYEFLLGKYKMNYPQRDFLRMDEWKNYFTIQNPIESSDYLFFGLNYNNELRQGIYNKTNKLTQLSDSENVDLFYFDLNKYGFINDIDNFIQFFPDNINMEGELITSVTAFEIVKWFKENPEKAAQLPPELQNLKNIQETDNPVVMIAKLKE